MKGLWLVKSEPSDWSWEDQCREGQTWWDGVRNHQAARHLKTMRCGDRVFFYQSVVHPSLRGVMDVIEEAQADPSDASGRFVRVRMATHSSLPTPVSLAEVKLRPSLQHLALVRQSRLSVMPVDAAAWAELCTLGGLAVDVSLAPLSFN